MLKKDGLLIITLSHSLIPQPIFCRQNPLDTQNPSSYTPTAKKECLINNNINSINN